MRAARRLCSTPAAVSQAQWRVAKNLLRHEHAELDPALPGLLELLDSRGAGECWHKHGTFKEHLHEVHNVLRLWLQPHAVCRLGLFHSAYSNVRRRPPVCVCVCVCARRP